MGDLLQCWIPPQPRLERSDFFHLDCAPAHVGAVACDVGGPNAHDRIVADQKRATVRRVTVTDDTLYQSQLAMLHINRACTVATQLCPCEHDAAVSNRQKPAYCQCIQVPACPRLLRR